MKKIFATIAAVIVTICVLAQAPQKMSYQAVIRNAGNALVTNHAIGMRISILQGESAVMPYIETQTPTTNVNGLVTIEIGGGTPISGTFGGIDWSAGTYFLKTETDPTGGTNYTIIGISQLLSVPYALYAKRAGEHYIGELYGGGIVFWVDHTGSHGLICSMIDFRDILWTGLPYGFESHAESSWDGQANTNAIMKDFLTDSLGAASICYNYTNIDYGTRYLF